MSIRATGTWPRRIVDGARLLLVAGTLLTALAACGASTTGASPAPSASTSLTAPTPAPTLTADSLAGSAPAAATAGTALAALDSLLVHDRVTTPEYVRDAFGAAWADVDANGCDTRNDMLARDLIEIQRKDSCVIASGTLQSRYTDATVTFIRGAGTSSKVQIDHVVALKDAWETGAYALTAGQRLQLANDPLNLQAIEGSVNASKSASNASEWLPPATGYRCTYVARQVSVKKTYGLWVTAAEKNAIAAVLASCPGQPSFTSTLTSPITPVAPSSGAAVAPSAAPVAPVTPDGAISYANCAAARAAGAAPLRVGDPGYSTKLDRDRDGIACE